MVVLPLFSWVDFFLFAFRHFLKQGRSGKARALQIGLMAKVTLLRQLTAYSAVPALVRLLHGPASLLLPMAEPLLVM